MSYKLKIEKKVYEIPAFNEIPTRALRKARKAENDIDRMFIILEESLGEDSPALIALDNLTLVELGEILKDWTEGASVGESSASLK